MSVFANFPPLPILLIMSMASPMPTALHWFTEQRTGNKDILHYLDDFLFGAEADSPKCQFTLQTFRDICKLWGVPVAEDKTVEPTEIRSTIWEAFIKVEFVIERKT
jgi:hypothetical protein